MTLLENPRRGVDGAVPRTEPYSSITVVSTLERAFNLDTCIAGLSLSKNDELHIECRKVQQRHFLIGLFREEKTD